MTFLDIDKLNSIDAAAFQNQDPFPWINPMGLLSEDGYQRLVKNLPDVKLFKTAFGRERKHGQKSHDRYVLKYIPGLDVPKPWREFIEELEYGADYKNFLSRLLKFKTIKLGFIWHYTPNGSSVSPHCDHKKKIGAHIIYLNTEDDWDEAWGGKTLVLGARGALNRRSAPEFDDFDNEIPTKAIGNYSLIFARTAHSWHGMRPIKCPKDRLRRTLLITVSAVTPWKRLKRLFKP